MGWTKIFRSHHTEWLENEIAVLRDAHDKEITDLKKAHADELNRAIEESARLRDEAQRIRLYLTPALQNVQLEPDKSAPPVPSVATYTGTPWQRILAREIAKQEKEVAARFTKPVEGESDGISSEGRVSTPLGEQSKPS
jgi:hypothetical protein